MPGNIAVGDNVEYFDPTKKRWVAARVTSVVSQTSLGLGIKRPGTTIAALNGGTPVSRWARTLPRTGWKVGQ